ncbi:hypothetical protein LINPERHAP2_LOCUS3259, partial [Linum perenne]
RPPLISLFSLQSLFSSSLSSIPETKLNTKNPSKNTNPLTLPIEAAAVDLRVSSTVAPLPPFQVDADATTSLRRPSQPHHRRSSAVRRPSPVLHMPSPSPISIQPYRLPLNQPLPPFFPPLSFSTAATVRGPAASVEAWVGCHRRCLAVAVDLQFT